MYDMPWLSELFKKGDVKNYGIKPNFENIIGK